MTKSASLPNPNRVLISAPGKVILFGEHAVVYQKPTSQHAVAASLGLRSYLYLETRDDGNCQLKLPDINVDRCWPVSDLPLGFDHGDSDDRQPLDMPQELKTRLMALMGPTASVAQEQAILAFLYLLVVLAPKTPKGFTICTRSFLPVGAGLGSSASYSVVIATSLLIQFGHLSVGDVRTEASLNTINRFAFKAEQVIHGNPSGVDNAVATFGGAKTFVKGQGFTTLEGFRPLKLLLTNTRVPRSTSALVALAAEKKAKYPEVIDPIMDAMDKVALRCRDAFQKHQGDSLLDELEKNENLQCDTDQDLVDINHCLLAGLGVSHISLEKVRSITASYGMKTKLTGAGGGGCAVTVLRDNLKQETINEAITLLGAEGFDCYQTSVGGIGVDAVELGEKEDEAWMVSADRAQLDSYCTFRELGPPDLCHIIKANAKPGLKEYGSYHYVSGIDASSSATLAAYLNSLTYSMDETQSWFTKSNAWRIRSGIYCCFNAFSRVDVRVEVKIPGGVESYFVDVRGERHEATAAIWQETYLSAVLRAILYSDDSYYRLAGYRKTDPITSLSAEEKFLEAVETLFWRGWQLGSKPEIQVATSVHNHLTAGVMKYFGDSFRFGPAIELFEKYILSVLKNIKEENCKDAEVGALLAQAYIGQNEEVKAVKVMYDNLKIAPMSYPLLHVQVDFLRSKKQYEMALKLAKFAVNTTPSEFLTWAKLTEVYIDLGDYKNALLTLNSCPMFTYSERDMHRMPAPAKTHLPIKPDIISSGVMEEDAVGRETEADPNLLRLPAPALHGTFAKAYSLLTRLTAKIGWDDLLKCRSTVFVMEEEYRMQKAKEEEKKSSGSQSQHSREDSVSGTKAYEEKENKEQAEEGNLSEQMENIDLNDDTAAAEKQEAMKINHTSLERPEQAAEDNKENTENSAEKDLNFSFGNKRLCERWLDNLFMVLYEDLRVYTFWRTEATHYRNQQMPYRKTGTEWELLGDLALRLWHESEAKEAFEQCLDHKFSAKAWMKLLEIYAKEGNVQRALLAAVKLTVYHERWYHEIVYPTEIACNLNKLIRKEGLAKMRNTLTSMNLPQPVQNLMVRYFDYGKLFEVEGYEF
ncbi:hypothetical protein EC973_006023 [Apophysomyces ossiformis]|uniref:mevalonate kinase n=1 Tax=Apophysomyces ossiformis TaxID=679940 RepID=A0A8H7ERV4_9FUNG|nr:hypothetical protein EC973_006023 [Apophysomyces ossiformis]